MARDRRLLVPGIEAVGLHADGDVEIEPDLHAELSAPDRPARPQLPVGGPLHEFDELDFVGVRALAQGGAFGVVRLPPLLPAIPTTACLNLCRSTSKQAKRDSSGAALGAEFFEVLLARRRWRWP